ncbi:ectonucleoside triphosphate diphosphohydrolase 8-like, partial [Branchiostoma floridae]|uniref:Ectonucleoside triphosphate diphosphohydrolase 8-like n=1 Tax=Branchiostoma floridae TaxID=7739 RepID=A0A9J7KEC0_BRAFL
MLPRFCFVLAVCLAGIAVVSSARFGHDSAKVGRASARVGRATVDYRYGVMFDAGSSGTRVYVYRWDQNNLPTKTADMTEMTITGTNRVRPGISSYVTDPPSVKTDLVRLLNSAATVVPQELQGLTPVYLKATAGMRLLEPNDVDAIFDQINQLFEDSSQNPFKFERGWAKVISGEEEGVFGWITVNFLRGVFDSNSDQETVGALDLGGASTQITFVPEGQIFANLFPLSISASRYDLYTNSYLKFGQDQFRLQLYGLLYDQAADKNAYIDNPCDLVGYNTTEDLGENRTAKIQGTANNQQCGVLVRQLLALDDTCYTEPCAIAGVYQPPVEGTVFYGTSALYYTSSAIGAIPEDGGYTSIGNIQERTDIFCRRAYADVLSEFGDFGDNYCMGGHYITALLGDGYKIDTSADDKVFITGEINGVGTGWTLG